MNGAAKLLILMVAVLALAGCPSQEVEVAKCQTDGDCEIGSICVDGACEPAVCEDVYAPVCGVDGETYANACEARAAHVEVAHEGECAQICGTIVGLPCPEGKFCDLPPGICLGADLQGVCEPIPEACEEIFEPVCGCDGVTYSNDCFRKMAQVQKDHDGECEGGEL